MTAYNDHSLFGNNAIYSSSAASKAGTECVLYVNGDKDPSRYQLLDIHASIAYFTASGGGIPGDWDAQGSTVRGIRSPSMRITVARQLSKTDIQRVLNTGMPFEKGEFEILFDLVIQTWTYSLRFAAPNPDKSDEISSLISTPNTPLFVVMGYSAYNFDASQQKNNLAGFLNIHAVKLRDTATDGSIRIGNYRTT